MISQQAKNIRSHRKSRRDLQSLLDQEIVPMPTLGTSNVPIFVVSLSPLGADRPYVYADFFGGVAIPGDSLVERTYAVD